MRMKWNKLSLIALSASVLLWPSSALAQSSQGTAKLKIHVEPKQAYVFVDGKAINDGSHTIRLAPGEHTISVHNYGYTDQTQKVDLTSKKKTKLSINLQPYGSKVNGPFGDIEFKGDPRASVELNGSNAAFFVGHVDEFDWDWIWHQRLLVQPGTYHVTVRREGDTIWTGNVQARAGEKVIVYLHKGGKEVTKNFRPGERLGAQDRFRAGIANTTVAVAPVTAELAANSPSIGCGTGDTLTWSSTNAVNTSITGLGTVPSDGNHTVTPMHDTAYVLNATGPGGEVTKTIKVAVNKEPTATLALSEPEVHYRKIGDKVVQDDSTTLTWSASNANSATVTPFGQEGVNGSRIIKANPNQTSMGPVNDDQTYTLTASNGCGGTVTKTATLHVVGSIDPPPNTNLASLFYPTAYPTRRHPKIGLVPGEKAVLDRLAAQFKNFGNYEQNANLVIVGYADVRGPEKYNQALSERRAELAKAYLVSKGVPASELEVRAKGKDDQISIKKVEALQATDAQKPDKWMTLNERTTWLAYNRRVDIVLEPIGKKSAPEYPNDAAAARLLWERPEPSMKALAKLRPRPAGAERASVSTQGN
jgi:hypothetical protein